jgi:hypothetical protein
MKIAFQHQQMQQAAIIFLRFFFIVKFIYSPELEAVVPVEQFIGILIGFTNDGVVDIFFENIGIDKNYLIRFGII